jgi:hypothetical protein
MEWRLPILRPQRAAGKIRQVKDRHVEPEVPDAVAPDRMLDRNRCHVIGSIVHVSDEAGLEANGRGRGNRRQEGRNMLLRAITGVFGLVRSFLVRFGRRRSKAISRSTAPAAGATASSAAAVVAVAGAVTIATGAAAPAVRSATTITSEERKLMSSGFDMPTEIAKLAERIIEPVAAKLSAEEREQVTGHIRRAFEQLDKERTVSGTSVTNIAAGIIAPVHPRLTDAERDRIVDRLSGAMAAFCQSGSGQRAA